MTTSAIYTGTIRHRCVEPRKEFTHRERRICDVQLLLAKPLWAVKAGTAVRSTAIAAAD